MRKTLLLTAAAALALAGCATSGGSGTASGGASSGGPPAASTAAPPAASQAALTTTTTPLGTVVVDSKGRTVYSFDKDTTGSAASACTGVCVGLWPELTTTSSTPTASGVTGTLGTAPTTGGARQLTLDGHRLYTFSGDSGAHQTNGQGYMKLWWVLAPTGQLIKGGGSAASSSSSYTGY